MEVPVHSWCPQGPEKGRGSLGTEVTVDCEPHCGCWEPNPGPSARETAEPFLQPLLVWRHGLTMQPCLTWNSLCRLVFNSQRSNYLYLPRARIKSQLVIFKPFLLVFRIGYTKTMISQQKPKEAGSKPCSPLTRKKGG